MQLEIEGKSYIQRLSIFYSILFEKKYGMKPMMSFAQNGKVFKDLSEYFNEYQVAYFLILFFEGAGDQKDMEFLESRTHNIFLLKSKIDTMRVYSKNVLGVDTDDLEQIKPIVSKLLNN